MKKIMHQLNLCKNPLVRSNLFFFNKINIYYNDLILNGIFKIPSLIIKIISNR